PWACPPAVVRSAAFGQGAALSLLAVLAFTLIWFEGLPRTQPWVSVSLASKASKTSSDMPLYRSRKARLRAGGRENPGWNTG
ncbi:MAG: hypothetical protein AAFQ98_00605, partial [Bacteroidota bacterium]